LGQQHGADTLWISLRYREKARRLWRGLVQRVSSCFGGRGGGTYVTLENGGARRFTVKNMCVVARGACKLPRTRADRRQTCLLFVVDMNNDCNHITPHSLPRPWYLPPPPPSPPPPPLSHTPHTPHTPHTRTPASCRIHSTNTYIHNMKVLGRSRQLGQRCCCGKVGHEIC
jgi:hypothetical protein